MVQATYSRGPFLELTLAAKREELEERLRKEPVEALKRRIDMLPDLQWGLTRAILEGPRGPHAGGKRVQLIAEIKKASPSKGRLVSVLEHRAMARTYTIGGAAGISVVTERKSFLGEIQFMLDVRMSMHGYYPGGRPAILRKDFLFHEYHLWEARAYGADAVLLIVAILDDIQLRDLIQQARGLEMDALVEVRSKDEIDEALKAGAELIGINNRALPEATKANGKRHLYDFNIDLAVTEKLRPLIPADTVVVSESGIRTREDVERLAKCGVHAILVGEALLTSKDVRAKVAQLLI